jgi:CBS domain-containing protein
VDKWKKLCLSADSNILMALENLNQSGAKFSLITTLDGKVIGTLTDGDIRRAFVKGVSVDDSVTKAMNESPVVAKSDLNIIELKKVFYDNDITHLPIIGADKKIINIIN